MQRVCVLVIASVVALSDVLAVKYVVGHCERTKQTVFGHEQLAGLHSLVYALSPPVEFMLF